MADYDVEQEELDDIDYHSNNKGPWKKILNTVLMHKGYVAGLLISVILLAVLDVCYPLVNSYAISHFFENTDPNRFDDIWIIILLYIGVAVGYGVIVFGFLYFAGNSFLLSIIKTVESILEPPQGHKKGTQPKTPY